MDPEGPRNRFFLKRQKVYLVSTNRGQFVEGGSKAHSTIRIPVVLLPTETKEKGNSGVSGGEVLLVLKD